MIIISMINPHYSYNANFIFTFLKHFLQLCTYTDIHLLSHAPQLLLSLFLCLLLAFTNYKAEQWLIVFFHKADIMHGILSFDVF